jgi:nitrogen fixation protein NifU and related proteins
MSDLRDLYQEMILAHSRSPRNHREMNPVDRRVDGHNPLCGDSITVYLSVEDGVVRDASFTGRGCAISVSSASLMTEAIKGRPVAEVEEIFTRFHDLVAGQTDAGDGSDLGKLRVFAGVREFPDRIKCAILGWHAMHAALTDVEPAVTTE